MQIVCVVLYNLSNITLMRLRSTDFTDSLYIVLGNHDKLKLDIIYITSQPERHRRSDQEIVERFTQCWHDIVHRLRRWPKIIPALGARVILIGRVNP